MSLSIKATVLLILFCFPIRAVAFQDIITSDQEADIVDSLDAFIANSGKCDHYAVAIDFTCWDLEGSAIGIPVGLSGEVLICLNEKEKFRRVTNRREVINAGESVELPWRTEFRRKGLITTLVPSGEERANSISFLSKFDPFEMSVGTYDAICEGICDAGYLVSSVDVEKTVWCNADTNSNLTFVFQRWPNFQERITFSKKQGGMPVKTSTRLAMDKKTKRPRVSKDRRDYNFLLSDTNCQWSKFEDIWVPTWIQMDRVYGDESTATKRRFEFELRWVLGAALEKIDRKKIERPDVKYRAIVV